ncbi:acyl-CoA dehydrogenase [Streptomyces sp. ARC32]
MNDSLTAGAGTSLTAGPPAGPRALRVPGDGPARARYVEDLLGDPFDAGNPHGQQALLAADERREVPAATEELLHRFGLAAEFVPRDLGGRLTGVEGLAQVLRPVFRRDVALGFGAGMTALFAASVVWTAGDERQRRDTALRLLGGGRFTILHREFAHANAILRGEYTARGAPGGGYVVDGRKEVVINADRADVFVSYVRTAHGDGPDSHSVFLLDTGRLPARAVRRLPRARTHGMRGAHYAGLELTHCPVPADALVGRQGEGVSLALRTFQVSRALVSGGALVGGMDSALRYAVRAAGESRRGLVLHGRRGRVLAGVFADLLACDSLAVAGLRLLDLAPEHALVPSAAVKYAVSALLHEDLDELAAVLGARGYDRGPTYGGFQKLVRDLPVAGLGHAGTADTQAVLVPTCAPSPTPPGAASRGTRRPRRCSRPAPRRPPSTSGGSTPSPATRTTAATGCSPRCSAPPPGSTASAGAAPGGRRSPTSPASSPPRCATSASGAPRSWDARTPGVWPRPRTSSSTGTAC